MCKRERERERGVSGALPSVDKSQNFYLKLNRRQTSLLAEIPQPWAIEERRWKHESCRLAVGLPFIFLLLRDAVA